MKQPSEDLFELIKSLSKSEKGYFKKYSSIHGGANDYIKLFDFIEKQKVYDEEVIKKKFEKESFIKRLAAVKHYLQESIMTSLRAYHSDLSLDTDLQNMFHSTEILFKKGLHKQCLQTVKKAKQLAYEFDMFLYVLRALRWERVLAFLPFKGMLSLSEIRAEKRSVLKHINQLYWLRDISSCIFDSIKRYGAIKNENGINAISQEEETMLLTFRVDKIPFTLTAEYYYSLGFYYEGVNNLNKSYTYRKRLVELYKSRPSHILIQFQKEYISAMNNFMISCLILERFDDLKQVIDTMRSFVANLNHRDLQDIERRVFQYTYVPELTMYRKQGKIAKGLEVIKEIEEKFLFIKNMDKMSEMILYYHVAYFYIVAEIYPKALVYLNKIFNGSFENIRQDIHGLAKILNLIVHNEIGNNDFLESAIRSTYRFQSKRIGISRLEKAVLEFIKTAIIPADSRKELNSRLAILKEKVIEVLKDPQEASILESFDIISWLESKIENRPMAEILKEKHVKNLS